MNSEQLQDAIVQVLENFKRCGLKRFSRQPNALPAEVLEKLAEKNCGDAPTSAIKLRQIESPPRKHRALAELTQAENIVASRQMPALADPLVGLAAKPWSLPVLPASERQQRFDKLAGQASECRQCPGIVSFRHQIVFGDGPLNPRLCFMGEAPGADEDRTGKPFVGKAGQLLTKIIEAMKLRREDVYILNALKCRPPQNRTPLQDEIENCRHFVETQLDILQPQYVVCLGAVAVRSILQCDQPIGRLRGRFHRYRNAQVVVTYHPSYLLRNEDAKKMVWEDMKMLMRAIEQGASNNASGNSPLDSH